MADDIYEEWIRNVRENRKDLKRAQLERTRDLMNQHLRDCLVTDYADLIPSLSLARIIASTSCPVPGPDSISSGWDILGVQDMFIAGTDGD